MNLIDFVMAREGCAHVNDDGSVSAYWDPYGKVWTIGYGTTGPDVIEGTVWSKARCIQQLQSRLDRARLELVALSPYVNWPPGAEDTLTDFVYNEGSGNYSGSTVRKCVEAGDWAGVKVHLLDWEYAGGKKLGGLVTRREDEAAMIGAPPVV